MPYKLDRTPTYRFAARDHLGPLATLQLRLAERVIADHPYRLTPAIKVWLGGRNVTLYAYGDLMIYLEIRDSETVSLYLVLDSKNLPEWFVKPTGTWFERIDLTD